MSSQCYNTAHFVPASTNHYVALGLTVNARPADIKKAYKSAALQFHPDKNRSPEAADIFTRISQAFQVLSDPDQKSVYDVDLAHGRVPPEDLVVYGLDEKSGRIQVKLQGREQIVSIRAENLVENVESEPHNESPPHAYPSGLPHAPASAPHRPPTKLQEPPQARQVPQAKQVPQRPRGPRPHIKFVIIGETGSGKTSFLNYLCNLPLMQAELAKEQSGQAGAFDNWEQQSFHISSSEHGGNASESQTKDANVYSVKGFDVDITAIDTPGLADTMGMNQDEEHLKKMQAAVLAAGYINCVVLVVNGRVARATAQISYVLSRLTSVLPSQIADKIVVVYTRVDLKEMLEFDPATIEKVINRPLPEEHEFVFDNPFACVELLQKSARRTGQPTSAKALRKLKHGFIDSSSEFQALLNVMATFPGVDVKYFKELFDAKASIEEKVVTLDNLLKTNADKQAKIIRAIQDVSTAKEWKQKLSDHTKDMGTMEWYTVQNASGKHDMVCNHCKKSCHVDCQVPMSDDVARFKACECFSWGTSKIVKIRTAADVQEVKSKAREVCGSVISVELQTLQQSNAWWLEVSDNCFLCNEWLMGNPEQDDYGNYEVWVKDVPFTKKAVTTAGTRMEDVKIGVDLPFSDWSNLMKGTEAACRHCGCKMGLHGHQKFTWKQKKSDPVIDHAKKAKFEQYSSEAEQKECFLASLMKDKRTLEEEAESTREELQHAVLTFKEKSTQTSYVRVLNSQLDYLHFQAESTKSDATIRSDVRDARMKAIQDQESLIRSNLSVLDTVEKSAGPVPKAGNARQPRMKTQRCPTCGGSGQVSNGLWGLSWSTSTCTSCHGSGQVTKPCHGGS